MLATVVGMAALGGGTSPALAADACPNAAVRAQQKAEFLPDCRAYEMVSPVDKNGYAVTKGIGMTKLSRDGEVAAYTSRGAFAGAPDGMAQTYRATRGSGGWITRSASPPTVGETPDAVQEFANVWGQATPDLRFGLLTTRDPLDPEADPFVAKQVYISTSDGTPTLVTRRADGKPAEAPHTVYEMGISDDGTRAYFTTEANMVPADASRVSGQDLYARIGNSTVLMSESGGAPLSACGSILGGRSFFTSSSTRRNAIAADGKQVIFSVPIGELGIGEIVPSCFELPRIYLRSDAEGLVQVSASEATVPEAQQPAAYEGASTDGTRILFTSRERLVDGAPSGGGLYLYRTDLPAGHRLKLLVSGSVFVVKMSDDARTIYFTSSNQTVPGGSGGEALYVYRDSEAGGTLKWIADDTAFDFGSFAAGLEDFRRARISADGNVLAFESRGSLTGFDNTRSDGAGPAVQVFVYDDRVGLRCASCDTAGQRPSDAPVSGDASVGIDEFIGQYRTTISDDGKRVFFMSPDRLVPEDANSKQDVYEYSDGRVHLISTGRGKSDSALEDVSDSGETVLFSTTEPVLSRDVDGGDKDVYVARVGGGFAEAPSRPAPSCDGDGCQGPARPPVIAGPVGSVSFFGPEASPQGPEVTVKPTVSKVKTVRGTSTRIRVKVPAKGTIGVSGSGLARSSTVASKAGSYWVSVRLSAQARRTLARKHRLSVRVSVRFAPAEGRAQTVRVDVPFAAPGKKPSGSRKGR